MAGDFRSTSPCSCFLFILNKTSELRALNNVGIRRQIIVVVKFQCVEIYYNVYFRMTMCTSCWQCELNRLTMCKHHSGNSAVHANFVRFEKIYFCDLCVPVIKSVICLFVYLKTNFALKIYSNFTSPQHSYIP